MNIFSQTFSSIQPRTRPPKFPCSGLYQQSKTLVMQVIGDPFFSLFIIVPCFEWTESFVDRAVSWSARSFDFHDDRFWNAFGTRLERVWIARKCIWLRSDAFNSSSTSCRRNMSEAEIERSVSRNKLEAMEHTFEVLKERTRGMGSESIPNRVWIRSESEPNRIRIRSE